MSNTHGVPDTLKEWQAIGADLLPVCVLSSTGLTPPGSGLTLTGVSAKAYALRGTDLVYIDQPAMSVTVPSVAGSHWLIAHADTHSAVAGWTRIAGSHLLQQQNASQPTMPDGATLLAQLTVTGVNITAVNTTVALTPPLSRQTADAVAITDGRISLGGHSSTGVLDVQGSVVSSDQANRYIGLRLWPVAPAGAAFVNVVRIEPATGAGLATTGFRGLIVTDQPAGMTSANGVLCSLSAGTNRYNIKADGTAVNYFAGYVGILTDPPGAPLDVTGNGRFSGSLGIQTNPSGATTLNIAYGVPAQSGIVLRPTSDTNAWALSFQNAAGTSVGTIVTSATATAYNTSSDARLKRSIETLVGALGVVQALRPVAFRWNADDSAGHGFLAHELQQVVPEAVSGLPDEVHPDGTIKPQQVDHSRLVPWLTAACQDLAQQVQALTARVASLEEQLGI